MWVTCKKRNGDRPTLTLVFSKPALQFPPVAVDSLLAHSSSSQASRSALDVSLMRTGRTAPRKLNGLADESAPAPVVFAD